MKKIVFKAKLGNGPVQDVGFYEMTDEEWNEDFADSYDSFEDFLQNAGSDWAYNAVHSDCLEYWAEVG